MHLSSADQPKDVGLESEKMQRELERLQNSRREPVQPPEEPAPQPAAESPQAAPDPQPAPASTYTAAHADQSQPHFRDNLVTPSGPSPE